MSVISSRVRGLLWVLAAACLAAGAVAALPRLVRHVPWPVERWIAGLLPPPALEAPCAGARDGRALVLWQRLVARIYPLDSADRELPITVELLPGKSVNAFATLGGHVYVYQGLLDQAQSADELAGVLAHEIEHVRNRHVMQAIAVNLLTWLGLEAAVPGAGGAAGTKIAYFFLSLKFSRREEAEADAFALQRLRAARVDAAGFVQFFERAARAPAAPDFLDSHPASELRAQLARQARTYPAEPIMSADEWHHLKMICP